MKAVWLWPRAIFSQVVKYPQVLVEHTSGWLLISLGYRIWIMSPLPARQTIGVTMMTVGFIQVLVSSFYTLPPVRVAAWRGSGLVTGAAFFLWLFLWILTERSGIQAVVVGVYPVMTVMCAVAYWSINRNGAFRE